MARRNRLSSSAALESKKVRRECEQNMLEVGRGGEASESEQRQSKFAQSDSKCREASTALELVQSEEATARQGVWGKTGRRSCLSLPTRETLWVHQNEENPEM
eukprot:1870574-Pleurochrysis_carterae.AAC.6